MSIYKGGSSIGMVAKGRQMMSAVYKGLTLVWTGIRSCFGSGRWVNEKPWLNDEKWKNE